MFVRVEVKCAARHVHAKLVKNHRLLSEWKAVGMVYKHAVHTSSVLLSK